MSLYPGETLTPSDRRPCQTCSRGDAVGRLERHADCTRLTVHHLCPECLERRYGEGWRRLMDANGAEQLAFADAALQGADDAA